MFIRIKREHMDDYGKVVQNQVIEVDDEKGRDLIARGLAENAQEVGPQGTGGPTSSDANKRRTGAGASQSSSAGGQAQQSAGSNAPGPPGQASSSSTTDTASLLGPGFSTVATEHGGRRKPGRRRSKV